MKKLSLKQKLYDKIIADGRVSYGAMCQFTVEEGYKVSTSERRLREWMAVGKIEPEWKLSKRNTRYIAAYLKPSLIERKTIEEVQIVEIDGRPVAKRIMKEVLV